MERAPAREPIVIAAEWRTRYWTTNPPRYDPHTAWSVNVVVSAAVPLRVALVVGEAEIARVVKAEGRGDRHEQQLGHETEVEPSAEDLADVWAALGVERPTDPTTWQVIPVRGARASESAISLFAVARHDTESLRNGRWRVRRDLWAYLPTEVTPLRSGARS